MRWVDRLLVLCAAVVVVASLLPLGARLNWMLELTTHFRLQYLVVTAVLLLLLALRRRWGVCAVLVAVGAVSAAPVLPYVPRALPQASAAGTPIKVLTVNVSFRQFSPRRLLEIVREAAPDVVVVQELTPHAESVLANFDTCLPALPQISGRRAFRHRRLVAVRARVGSERSRSAACPRSRLECADPRDRSRSSACT